MGAEKKGISREMQNTRLAPMTFGLAPPITSRQDRKVEAKGNAKEENEKGGEEVSLMAKGSSEMLKLQARKAKSPASTSTSGMTTVGLQTGVITAMK
jgi:hypothetical protein